MVIFANNFLAGALITLLIPGCVFIAISVWYARSVLRLATTRYDETAQAPTPTPPGPTPTSRVENEPPSAQA